MPKAKLRGVVTLLLNLRTRRIFQNKKFIEINYFAGRTFTTPSYKIAKTLF